MSNETKRFYEFDKFRLDTRERILYHNGASVALKPKAIQTLVVLIENNGEVVSKEELIARVWHDSFVEENSLSVNIYSLRKAFAVFDAETVFIETVSRRGFRFAVPIREINAAVSNESQNKQIFAESDHEEIEDLSHDEVSHKPTANVNSQKSHTARLKPISSHLSRQILITIFTLVCCVAIGGASFYATSKNPVGKSVAATRNIRPELVTQSLEARQFYMRGRELWSTRDNVKMAEGIEFFRRAIALDPNFAAPYIGIADSLSMMRNDAEDWRQAAEHADAAIRLAPNSADAHATLGFIAAMNNWRWREAESYFKRALELDPNCGKAHQWYATLLLIDRRFVEAEAHLKRAIEIEPMSPTFNCDLCELYVFAKRGEEALSQCGKTNVINPDFRFANISEVLIQQKRYDDAARENIKRALQYGISEKTAKNAAWYKAYLKNGYRGWIQTEIDNNEKHADVLLGEYNLSIAYARIGDKEKTLDLLEKAFVGHTFLLPFANARPDFDFVRDEPRFQNLMRRIGLNQN